MEKFNRGISILFIVIMLAAGGYWAFHAGNWTVPGTAAAVVCYVLFIMTGLRAIPVLTEYIAAGRNPQYAKLETRENLRKQTWIKIVAWVLLSRVLLLILAYAFHTLKNGYSGSLFDQFNEAWHLSGIDVPSYLGIAENWYVTEGDPRFHIVFLPFFPILIRAFHFFTDNYLAAGLTISNLCAVAMALVAYELAALDMDRKEALRVVKYIFIFPAAFFFLIPMTESLFLLLSLLSIYLVRQKKWLPGCLCAALAGFTRSPGVLLAVPILIELARHLSESYRHVDKRAFLRMAAAAAGCLAVVPLGLLAYLYINYAVHGNPLQFSIYQKEHWFQEQYLFFDTVRYQMEYAAGTFKDGDSRSFLGLWLPNLVTIFTALYVMYRSAGKLHPAYTAFLIVYFVFVTGPTWLLSAPRYLTAAFPLAFAVVLLTKDKEKDSALTVLCGAGSLLYLGLFVWGYPIY
ncbi:hypothetical protein C2I18_05375 [Paenibacillus sp. PK3_47]|uniref:hypothetical protein n=1 Tax=Paenibacillus sp. PK3_47 TaxID=2072642 RepID=UPI00201D4618|nr:hypothetical protein [Paenibacillus sp. PK3_47]UQZ33046.1 hypothetical protein C2I18_05375 [Paenibacillus sp. PK3_47]